MSSFDVTFFTTIRCVFVAVFLGDMKHFYLKGTIKGVYWTTTRHNWPKLVQKAKNEPGIKHNISYFDNISDFKIKHKFILDNSI